MPTEAQLKYWNSMRGKVNPGGFKKGHKDSPKYWLGKKRPSFSEETRSKMRKRMTGNKYGLGHKHTEKTRKKISLALGIRKGFITPINKIIRHSLEYRLWRTAVFTRDNFTCIWCGLKNGNGKTIVLNADHIKPFAFYPELRFAIDNGRTLCKDCHRKTGTWGRKMRLP